MNKLISHENVKFVNQAQVSKHLECPICSNFLHQPLRLNCGHTFCQSCYDGLKSSVQNNQNFRCAICREAIDLRYISPDKVAKNLLDEQLVYCLNQNQFCLWQGPLSQLSKHLDECQFKEHDEISQSLIMQFDKKVLQTAKNSDLNTVIQNQTYFDDKFQENYNKNVGGQLMARLLNKDKNLGMQIARTLSLKEDSKQFGNNTKKSADEKQNTNQSYDTEVIEEQQEEQKKNVDDLEIDNLDDVFQMFSDEKSDTKDILNSQTNKLNEKKEKNLNQKQKGRKKQTINIEEDEDYVPQQERKRGNKKRRNVGDAFEDLQLQQQIQLYQQYGIDINNLD
ncbi:hypothetical protein ABPG72_009773 [Tetrahymena utriculariae]